MLELHMCVNHTNGSVSSACNGFDVYQQGDRLLSLECDLPFKEGSAQFSLGEGESSLFRKRESGTPLLVEDFFVLVDKG